MLTKIQHLPQITLNSPIQLSTTRLTPNLKCKTVHNTELTFFGLTIGKDKNSLIIHQKKLTEIILNTFNMNDYNYCNVPIQPKLNLSIGKIVTKIM